MAVVDEESIAMVERGVAGLMRHLEMRTDGPDPLAESKAIWITRNQVLRAGQTGLFHASVAKGQAIAKDALIGHITDFYGNKTEEIRAPFDGEILYVVGTPPITKGEPVAMVGAAK
jgi:predicted deacylase